MDVFMSVLVGWFLAMLIEATLSGAVKILL